MMFNKTVENPKENSDIFIFHPFFISYGSVQFEVWVWIKWKLKFES